MPQGRMIEDVDQSWDQDPGFDSAIETRLIGTEDIYWDSEGVEGVDSFTDRTGAERKITGINSGKIPLQQLVKEQLPGSKTVTDALLKLVDRTGGGSGYSILEEDKTVVLTSTLTHAQKQTLINSQVRNLGGHVLTVQFPESIDLTISSNFVFSGFYNGKLVIDLNGIELSDAVVLSSLLLVLDCNCHVEIAGGTLKHTASDYGIKAVRCPHIYLTDLQFTGSGSGASGSYALYAEDSDGYAENCTFENDNQVKADGFLAMVPVEDHNASSSAHSALFSGKADVLHTHNPEDCGADPAGSVTAHDSDADAHATLFSGKADVLHTHNPEDCGAEASGTASAAVTAHDEAASPHSGVLAPLASPAFTGNPTAPTATGSSNDTTISTTAFVQSAVTGHNGDQQAHSDIRSDISSHMSNAGAHRNLVPAGVVFPFAGNGSVPSGFLLCDGTAYNHTDYPDLYAAIGQLYGTGDGVMTDFNVPDFRGEFLRGYKSGESAAIGTKQNRIFPALNGTFVNVTGAGNFTALTSVTYNASASSVPDNYAIQWIIKY